MSNTTGMPLADFSTTAAALVHGADGATAYSYEDVGSGLTTMPIINLTGATPYAYTDCNGWVNYVLNSVAPLHFAVLSAARDSSTFDRTLTGTDKNGSTVKVSINESQQPFARAFVLAHDFSNEPLVTSDPKTANGFAQVADFRSLQAGDVIAYALGIYSNLDATGLPVPGDTGHTMIVTGTPVTVDTSSWTAAEKAALAALDIGGKQVASVYAVSMVDSSDVPHLRAVTADEASDDRLVEGSYTLTSADKDDAPTAAGTLHAGGLGTGTMLFALDADGNPIGFEFDSADNWHPTAASGVLPAEGALITAARLEETIDLSALPSSSLVDGMLQVTLMADRTTSLGGVDYSATEHVIGNGGLQVNGTGTLTLSVANSFTGGVELQGVTLDLTAAGAAGTGIIRTDSSTDNVIDIAAGHVTVEGGGADTISAASGGSLIVGGTSLNFTGSGASTVVGGVGSATISGGAGGFYIGGSAGDNVIHGAGHSSLWGAGFGNLLTGGVCDVLGAAASGNTTLIGGQQDVLVDGSRTLAFTGGDATLFGSNAGGTDTIVGSGSFTAVGRGGDTTVFGGSGGDEVWAGTSLVTDVAGTGAGTLIAGSSRSNLWIGFGDGAQTILGISGNGGGTVNVFGFRPGTDSFGQDGYAAASNTSTVRNGSLVITLADHTTFDFVGVTSLK